MHRHLFLLVFILMAQTLWAEKAAAGPLFCLNGPSMKPQCMFYSAKACRKKAASITGALCGVNAEEIEIPKGPGAWCLVTSTRYVQCYYDNFNGCQRQARSKNGLCVRSFKRPPPSKEFESDVENLF